jgi:hypothetical protein
MLFGPCTQDATASFLPVTSSLCADGVGFVTAMMATLAASSRVAPAKTLGQAVPEVDRLAVHIRWRFGRILSLNGRESYRELRLEPLCCPHRLRRGTAPHEREYARRKDRFWAARSRLERGTFDRSAL